MKLRNKKTGEIVEWEHGLSYKLGKEYPSLAEFNEEWEDYEEDELLYVISAEHKSGYQCVLKEEYPEICEVAKELGIGFETEKECQEFCNKLLAWERLKDKGFKVDLWDYDGGNYQERIKTGRILFRVKDYEENDKDLDLLFGGEK